VLQLEARILKPSTALQQQRRSARGRYGLTRREGEIADLVVDGCSNRQIAEQLGCGYQVIKNVVTRIYIKVGCNSRTELLNMVLFGTEARR
jgi:DNA-binding CsgD family transcriptional regulator